MNTKHLFADFFRKIQLNFSRLYGNILCQLDLTLPQYTLLGFLAKAPMTMTEAGSKMQCSKATITYLTDQLEQKKCLVRIHDAEDRRVIHLKVLPRGAQKVRRAQSEMLKHLLRALDHFSAQDQKVITNFYEVLAQTAENSLKAGIRREK